MRTAKRNQAISITILLASTWRFFGCAAGVESTDVRTSGIFPEIGVTANGLGTSTVVVRLKTGDPASNTFLELAGEDALTATRAGVTKTLTARERLTYGTTFETETGGPIVVSFQRGAVDTSAPASTVTVPDPFALALGAPETSRATGDVTFTWTPPGSGDIDLTLLGDCIEPLLETIPDDGAATISRDRIRPRAGAPDAGCTAYVTLTRSLTGQVDPAFTEGGNVLARQTRTATFTSTP